MVRLAGTLAVKTKPGESVLSTGRKIAVGLLAILLFIAITGGVWLAGVGRVITDRDYVKQALGNEKVYNAVARAVVEQPLQNANIEGEAQSQELQVNQASVKKLIDQFLTPDNYRHNIGVAVDGIYDWLEAKTDKPQFRISLASDKVAFQNYIIETVTNQYNALPPCEGDPALVTEINPLDADCRLPTFTNQDVAAYIRSNAQGEQFANFFNNASFNSEELFGSLTPEASQNWQTSYKTFKLAPWILLVSVVVLSSLMMLAVGQRSKMFKITGLAILIPTIMVLIGGLIGWLAGNNIADTVSPNSSAGSDAMGQLVQAVVGSAITKVNQQVLLMSAVLLLLSLGLIFGQIWLNRRGGSSSVPIDTRATGK